MSRIKTRFEELTARNEGALIVYVTVGDPDYDRSKALIRAVLEAGADILELGIPFSDPLADGPVIQAAAKRALEAGMTMERALAMTAELRNEFDTPFVLFSYINPMLQFGLKRFADAAKEAGADGVLITDLPPDEADEWQPAAITRGLDPIYLIAPTSTSERAALVARQSRGFIYCVSRTGVTGAQSTLPPEVAEIVARARAAGDTPVAVGFGISNPEHVKTVCTVADGAVVGSALVKLAAEHADDPQMAQRAGDFVRQLKEATRR